MHIVTCDNHKLLFKLKVRESPTSFCLIGVALTPVLVLENIAKTMVLGMSKAVLRARGCTVDNM